MIECVINISEGRDLDLVQEIARTAGNDLLDVHCDADHNRSVITVVGAAAPPAVINAAVERLDLRTHTGVHPRIGVVDVVPFVPLAGSTFDDALRTLGLPGIRPVAPRERAPNTQPIVTTNDIAAQEAALEALGLRVLKPQPAPLTEVNRSIPTDAPPSPTIAEEAAVRAQKQLLLPEQIKLDTQTISPSQSQIPTREITRQAAQDTVLNAVGELPIGQDKSAQLAANQVEVNLATNSINRTFRLGLKKSQTGSNTWGV